MSISFELEAVLATELAVADAVRDPPRNDVPLGGSPLR
jgi:hypothetical protein